MLKRYAVIAAAVIASAVIFMLLFFFRGDSEPKNPVVGILNYAKVAESSVIGFREGIESLGYIEGDNIEIIYNGVISDVKALEEEAKMLSGIPVDIIISMSSKATLIARKAVEGTDIPVIFGPVSNPIENGIIKDLRHSGENITGVMFGLQEAKRLEFLTRIDPSIRRVFVPYNFGEASAINTLKMLEPVIASLDLEFIHADIADASGIAVAMKAIPDDADAVFIPTDPLMAANVGEIAGFSTARGLISSSPHRDGVKAGALFSFSFDLIELGKEVARLTDQVLKGTPAEDLPVEVSEFFLSLNLTTAERLNLQLPEDLIRSATIYK